MLEGIILCVPIMIERFEELISGSELHVQYLNDDVLLTKRSDKTHCRNPLPSLRTINIRFFPKGKEMKRN